MLQNSTCGSYEISWFVQISCLTKKSISLSLSMNSECVWISLDTCRIWCNVFLKPHTNMPNFALCREKDALWQKTNALEFEQKLRDEEMEKDVNYCMDCHSQFSWLLRKHNCRSDGPLCNRNVYLCVHKYYFNSSNSSTGANCISLSLCHCLGQSRHVRGTGLFSLVTFCLLYFHFPLRLTNCSSDLDTVHRTVSIRTTVSVTT